MDLLKRRVMALQTSVIDEDVTQEKLESLGLREVTLRDYQISGVKWLSDAFGTLHQSGCILGDEMGLGKTIQVISFNQKMSLLRKRGCLLPQNDWMEEGFFWLDS